jgi:cytochrome c556
MERAIRSHRKGLGTSGLNRVLLSFGVGLMLVGCSGGSSNPGPVTQSVPPSLPAAKPAPDPKKSADVPEQGDESVEGLEHRVAVHTDAKGRKWLGDVPYDVFFDHPLEVAAEGGQSKKPDNPATVAANTSPTRAAEKSSATAEKKPAAGQNDWSRLVDIDVLDAEVKRIRNDLAAQLQSVAKYNSHCQEIAVSGATLATVAQIVAEHSGSVSWKSNAALVRDLGTKIHDSAHGPGASALHATKAFYEQLVDVLDGNGPAGAAAVQPQRDFSEIAKRDAIMKRMDHSFQWLKRTGPAQQILKKQSANALHEASLLAAMARVITVGHYDSAEDPKYKAHAEDLSNAAAAIAAAVKSDDATAFTDAVSRVQKRCDACHADYRFQ